MDGVEDVKDISGPSRFVSGGIGGITSQLSILFLLCNWLILTLTFSRHISHRNIEGIRTQSVLPGAHGFLQTQMMSNTGEQRRTLPDAVRNLWKLGGLRAYYRGLTVGHNH